MSRPAALERPILTDVPTNRRASRLAAVDVALICLAHGLLVWCVILVTKIAASG